MNSFFVPQLGSQIYTMAGMTTHLQLQADNAGSYPGLSAQFSGDGFADMTFKADAVPGANFSQWVETTRATGPVLDAQSYADLAKPSKAVAPFTYRAVASDLFSRIVMPEMSMNDPIRRVCLASSKSRTMNILGKLDWSAIPFDQPIVMGATAGMVLAIVSVLSWIILRGTFALLVARVDHLGRPQAHRRHVHRAGTGHASARI